MTKEGKKSLAPNKREEAVCVLWGLRKATADNAVSLGILSPEYTGGFSILITQAVCVCLCTRENVRAARKIAE